MKKIAIKWITIYLLIVDGMQQPGYDIIAQFIIGYVLQGKPIANLLFKIYGRISTIHALSFLADLKLGHYMKIPPRCMYTAQVMHKLRSFIYPGAPISFTFIDG